MKYGELIRLLQQNGWFAVRQKGSHIVLAHPDKVKQIVVPAHASKEVKKGLLVSILKEADIKTKKR
jgi:predicted RNA binding protein YcfA (HicA-like mRNA interferase family)